MSISNGSMEVIHASCVAVKNRAVLIIGASGTGKSKLALQLISLGGVLVADDRTRLKQIENKIMASCPGNILGQIEARGIGIIKVPCQQTAPVELVVDMDQAEKDRLPEKRRIELHGVSLPLLSLSEQTAFAEAVFHILNGSGQFEPEDEIHSES